MSQDIRRDFARFGGDSSLFEELACDFVGDFVEWLDDCFVAFDDFADDVAVAEFGGEDVADFFAFDGGLNLLRHDFDGDETGHALERFIVGFVVVGVSLCEIDVGFEGFFFGDLESLARLERFARLGARILDRSELFGDDDLLHFDFFGRRISRDVGVVECLNVGFSGRGEGADFFVGEWLERFEDVFGGNSDDFQRCRGIGLLVGIPQRGVGDGNRRG